MRNVQNSFRLALINIQINFEILKDCKLVCLKQFDVCPRNENVQNVQKRSGCPKPIYMIYPFTSLRRQFFIC